MERHNIIRKDIQYHKLDHVNNKSMKTIILFFILFAFISCNSNSNLSKTQNIEIENKNSILIDKSKFFLNWYKKNYEKINDFQYIKMAQDNNGISFYQIDSNNVNKYMSFLKSSNLFSDYYLNNMKSYFELGDIRLKKLKQNDGPPEGFEFDLILLSQEPESILDNIQSVSYNVEFKSIIKIDDYLYIRYNNINLIDSIYIFNN